MYKEKYVFPQILEFIDGRQFKQCVDTYTGKYRTRTMSITQQFRAMLFGQLPY